MSGGFNLTELMIVVLIIGILAAIAVPNYVRTQERAKVQEAVVALKLIRAGEEIYQGEYGAFYGPDDDFGETSTPGTANTNLRLDLNETDWDYEIIAADASSFTATADRTGGGYDTCVYTITESAADPSISSGTCP